MDDEANPAAAMGRVRLEACPRCAYSLQGLPESGRCPECGFDYDERTFVLQGISRGMSSLTPWRVVLWLFVGSCAALGPQIMAFTAFIRREWLIFDAMLFVIWLTVLIYLLATGKRERRGIELFVFSAGGFGPCLGLRAVDLEDARIFAWGDVDSVRIDRLGSKWHRLRIGRAAGGRRLHSLWLDAGISMDAAQAAWVRAAIEAHLARAHSDTPEHSHD